MKTGFLPLNWLSIQDLIRIKMLLFLFSPNNPSDIQPGVILDPPENGINVLMMANYLATVACFLRTSKMWQFDVLQ